jgi:hypothetical protein
VAVRISAPASRAAAAIARVISPGPPQDIRAHIDFMLGFNKELKAAGELVDAEGLAGPMEAPWCGPMRTVRRK